MKLKNLLNNKIQHHAVLSGVMLAFLLSSCGGDDTVIPPAPDSGGEIMPPGPETPPDDKGELVWTLDFEDDFSGSSVNTNNWSMYNSAGHSGHGLRRPSAYSVKDGLLVVTAEMIDGNVVSGGMRHRKDYLYPVRFEFKARCEPDPSLTMSGVVLTWPQAGSKEDNGEMDVFETGHSNASRKPFSTFIHYRGGKQVQFKHDADASQWQEMALEWHEEALYIYRGGEMVWSITDKNKVPDTKHHLCIQLDAFKDSMTGTVHMYVDYVRIYTGSYKK